MQHPVVGAGNISPARLTDLWLDRSLAVMEQIKSLLLAPAIDTPLKAEIATQYTADLAAYEAKVRETVAAYAK